MVSELFEVWTPESLALRVTVKAPLVENAWVTVLPVEFVPSPKFQFEEYGGVPPVSVSLNVTDWPIWGLVGFLVKPALNAPRVESAMNSVIGLALASFNDRACSPQ